MANWDSFNSGFRDGPSSKDGCVGDGGRLYRPGQSWPIGEDGGGGSCGRRLCSKSLVGGWEIWEEK